MIVVTFLIILFAATFVYVMLRQYRQHSAMLASYNRSKLNEIEREKRLLVADLHDDIGPILSYVRYSLQAIEPNSERHIKALEEANLHLESVHTRIRDIVIQVLPPVLENNQPLYALGDYRETCRLPHPLNIDIILVEFQGLSHEQSLQLFRMLQEILHNTIKHSRAKNLIVSGEQDGSKIVIRAADDGIGFNLDEARKRSGMGLQNLHIRADLLGAELMIDTAPGQGTSYTIQLSLAK